jgi:hypothetical protein
MMKVMKPPFSSASLTINVTIPRLKANKRHGLHPIMVTRYRDVLQGDGTYVWNGAMKALHGYLSKI